MLQPDLTRVGRATLGRNDGMKSTLVDRLVLVEHVDLGLGECGEHGSDPMAADRTAAYPKLLGLSHAIAKHVGTAITPVRFRYADGDSPTTSRNVLLNVPRLVNPTSKQISVTDRWVSRNRNIARSTRRRCRYRCGVSPNVARKVRLKCAGETCAMRASVGTSSGSV